MRHLSANYLFLKRSPCKRLLRHEICQKLYTNRFSGHEFYTLNFAEFQQFWLIKTQKNEWKMEKFTPLAKILHCHRQWRISPLRLLFFFFDMQILTHHRPNLFYFRLLQPGWQERRQDYLWTCKLLKKDLSSFIWFYFILIAGALFSPCLTKT